MGLVDLPTFTVYLTQMSVDGRNPAPPGMYKPLNIMGHLPYHLVSINSFDPNGLWIPTTSRKVRKVYALPAFSSGWTENLLEDEISKATGFEHLQVALERYEPRKKTRGPLLSIESWLFNGDPYNGLL